MQTKYPKELIAFEVRKTGKVIEGSVCCTHNNQGGCGLIRNETDRGPITNDMPLTFWRYELKPLTPSARELIKVLNDR